MLAFACLFLVLGLALLAARWSRSGPLDGLERLFLAAAPAPIVLTLLLPALLQPGQPRAALNVRLSVAGTVLSLALVLAGLVLLWRRSRQHSPWDIRILAAALIAGMPVLMVAVVALIYAVLD